MCSSAFAFVSHPDGNSYASIDSFGYIAIDSTTGVDADNVYDLGAGNVESSVCNAYPTLDDTPNNGSAQKASVLNTSSWVDGSVISSANFAEGVSDLGGNTGMAYCLFQDGADSYWSVAVAFSAESDITACLPNYTFTHANGCVAPTVAAAPTTAAAPTPFRVPFTPAAALFTILLGLGAITSVWQSRNKRK